MCSNLLTVASGCGGCNEILIEDLVNLVDKRFTQTAEIQSQTVTVIISKVGVFYQFISMVQ